MNTEFEKLMEEHTKSHSKMYWAIVRGFNRMKDWLTGMFITRPHIIKTTLPIQAWHEYDLRLLYANMAVLVEFYKTQMLNEHGKLETHIGDESDYDGMDAETKVHAMDVAQKWDTAWNTMAEIVAWWNSYDSRQEEIYAIMTTNGKAGMEAESKLAKEEQEMLQKLIEVRGYMWT